MPGRLKKPPVCGAAAGRVTEVVEPGWVMVRSSGRAPGAVVVDGGAEKVREPRLPPPPGRASTELAINTSAAPTASITASGRKRKSMSASQATPSGVTVILVRD